MVAPRAASLAVEAVLGAATMVAFAAVLVGGSRASRLARGATIWGAAWGLAAALATLGTEEIWLFEALRVDHVTQAVKAVICAGLLALALRRAHGDTFARARTVDPWFRLVAATSLAVAAGAGDLLVLWLALDIASAAAIAAVASGGRWSSSGTAVRRLLAAWLATSLFLALGIVLAAAAAGATRYTALEARLPGLSGEPVVVIALVLIGGSIVMRVLRFALILTRRTTTVHRPPSVIPG